MRALCIVAMLLLAACSQLLGIQQPTAAENDVSVAIATAGSATDVFLPFDVVVTNNGPDMALDTEVTVTPPAGSQLSASNTSTCQPPPTGQTRCFVGRLAPFASTRIRMSVSVAGGAGTLAASVTATGDVDTSNNQASFAFDAKADLEVTYLLTGTSDNIGIGTLHSYVFRVSNLGPSTARDVVLRIDAPGFMPQGATGINWSCSATTCTLPSLVPFAHAYSVTWSALAPTTPGAVDVTGTVSSSTPEVALGNNTTGYHQTVTTDADLWLSLAASPDPVATGGTLTYTLAVHDNGPSGATSLTVTDTLPAGVTFVSATGSGWTCAASGQDVSCTRPTLAPGDAPPIDLVVTAPATAGTVTNSATVSATSPDGMPANNTASIATTVQ